MIKKLVFAMCAMGLLFGSVAFADVVPPEKEACKDKNEGDACKLPDDGDGTCQSGTCKAGGGLPAPTDGSNKAEPSAPDASTGGNDKGTTPPKSGCSSGGDGLRFGFSFLLLFLGFFAAVRTMKRSEVRIQNDQ